MLSAMQFLVICPVGGQVLFAFLFQKGSALKRKNLLQGANSFLEEWTPFEELCPIEVNRNSCFFQFVKLVENMEV